MGFFLWGYVKGQVFVSPLPENIEDLKAPITLAVQTVTTDILHRVWEKFEYRLDIVRVIQRGHIEHL